MHRSPPRAPGRPTTAPLAVGGAAQWRDEPSAEALLKAGGNSARGRAVLLRPAGPVRQRRPAQRHGRPRPATGCSTGLDPTDKGFYHGGDLKGVIDKLDYIQGLGTTAIWLAPIFKNRPVQGAGADVSAGYHGYWITDFTQVDPHFGTNEELKRLVKLAHQRGIKIYLDVIVNHTADVIKYAEDKYAYVDKATCAVHRRAGRGPSRTATTPTAPGPSRRSTRTSFPYTPTFADRGGREASRSRPG